MALEWHWANKVGEATFRQKRADEEWEDHTVNLYEGNAYLIFIHEWTEGTSEKYQLTGFFVDKDHAKRCLGIDKKCKDTYGHNSYYTEYSQLMKIRLNKGKCRNYKDLVTLFAQAFDNLTIELFTEE